MNVGLLFLSLIFCTSALIIPLLPDNFESQIYIRSGLYLIPHISIKCCFFFQVVTNKWEEGYLEVDWNQKSIKVIQGLVKFLKFF